MATLAAGASRPITLLAGYVLEGSGTGTAVLGNGPGARQQIGLSGTDWGVGPYPYDQIVQLTAITTLRTFMTAPTAALREQTALVSRDWNRARNNANLNALMADMDPGQVMLVPEGEFEADLVLPKGLRVLGAGRPSSDGLTMTGGTILRGEINVQNALGAEIANMGINQLGLTPGSYPNLITGGISAVGDSTTVLNQYIHDIELLGRGFGGGQNQQHGIIIQNGRGALIERVGVWRALNNFVSRASGVTIKDSFSYNSDAGAVLFKSDTAGGANDCFDNVAINVRGYASTGFQALFSSRADTSDARACNNNRFIDCLAEITSGTGIAAAFNVYGIASSASNRGTLFLGCTSRNDQSGAAFLVNDDFSDGVAYVGCRAERFSGFSFQSGATTPTNLPSAVGCTAFRTGFADIVNVFGRWAVCNVNGQGIDTPSGGQTLAELGPAGFYGRRAFIRDATAAPALGAAAAGGGSLRAPVYDDGTTWRFG